MSITGYSLRPFHTLHTPSLHLFPQSPAIPSSHIKSRPCNLDHEGFIHVPAPGLCNLSTNTAIVPGVENVYLQSMYHQLHCLRDLQRMVMSSLSRRTKESGIEMEETAGEGERYPGREGIYNAYHAQHCFDYLRQGIMCAGDTRLELADSNRRGLYGWDVMH